AHRGVGRRDPRFRRDRVRHPPAQPRLLRGRSEAVSRVALVTGGSRGIGRAIAVTLAGAGHRVVVNYATRAEAADGVCEEIESAGGEAMAVGADVSDAEAVAKMFEAVAERFGPVEILVNNAGITRDDLVLRMSVESFDTVIATNLRSA